MLLVVRVTDELRARDDAVRLGAQRFVRRRQSEQRDQVQQADRGLLVDLEAALQARQRRLAETRDRP